MSYLRFAKMHGAGNDFIVIDNTVPRKFTPDRVRALCDRQRGIGADGLILLSKSKIPACSHVVMEFYNCDGSKAALCGNGLRCAAAFAYQRCLSETPGIVFTTGSGELRAQVLDGTNVRIELPVGGGGFRRVDGVAGQTVYFGHVGVPHAVVLVDDVENADIRGLGAAIRNDAAFSPEGTNVNFLNRGIHYGEPLRIRTFERGVEDETLACGTGTGAAAAVLRQFFGGPEKVSFLSRSGDVLEVEISGDGNILKGLHLTGPAVEAFHGATETFDLE